MANRLGPRPISPTACTDPTCPSRTHATVSGYRTGCRSPQAREAWRLYVKRRREHRQPAALTDATGTIRRIRALAALGWSCTHVAAALNVDKSVVQEIARGERGAVQPRTAAEVTAVFERWSTTRGPSTSARIRAQGKGWFPPAAWDDIDDPDTTPNLGADRDQLPDDVAVQRLLAGQARISDTQPVDRTEAVRQLAARGLGATAIAHRLRTNTNTVRTLLAAILKEAADAA